MAPVPTIKTIDFSEIQTNPKYNDFHSRKYIWKYRLQSGDLIGFKKSYYTECLSSPFQPGRELELFQFIQGTWNNLVRNV